MKKKIFSFILALLPVILLSSCNKTPTEDVDVVKPETRTLSIYALNDFHGAYMYNENYSQTGLSRIGKYLESQKENDPENTIILSSGDMFQGGPESNITRGNVVIDSMNAIGFDAMAIGNHEFDWGEDTLNKMEERMSFPLLGINVFYRNNKKRPSYLAPSTIVKKEGLKVGIIGGIMASINSSIIATVSSKFDFVDSEDLIKEEATRLREKEKCDVVILTAHDGSYRNYKEVASDIDALFLGHSHSKFEGEYNGLPYVQGEENGKYLSNIKLNLTLDKETNRYIVDSNKYKNIYTFESFTEESNKVNEVYNQYKDQVEAIRDEELYNFTSTVSKSEFSMYVSRCLKDYINENQDKFKYKVSAGAMNNHGIRSDIPVGKFTYGDLIKVYPFENVATILKMTKNQYDSFVSSSGMYTVKDNEPIVVNGYYYAITNDYVAYQTNCEQLIPYNDYLIRDIVASNLKTKGYY